MKKRLLAKILSVFIIVSFITVNGGIQPQIVKAAEVSQASTTYSCEIDGIVWNYEVDTVGNAINVGPREDSLVEGSITIPNTLDGRKVISIKDSAFENKTNLISIVIPEGVTSIGYSAFRSCTSLVNITIPHSVTKIKSYTFCDCDSLVSINIPKGIISIERYAIYYCKNLKEFIVEEDNPKYASINGVLYNKEKTEIISYPTNKEGENYKILDSVTKISSEAFYNCEKLSSIIIPEGVTSIDGDAFTACTRLSSIILPKGITNISSGMFAGCERLKYIEIPEGVTSIKGYAFSGCESLTSIIIPEKVTSLDSRTFNLCTHLTSISIPDSITSIADDAFKECYRLTNIYANNGSYASDYAWGDGKTVDTNTGYISESSKIGIKADVVGTINSINDTLLSYKTAGGLETNTAYKDLKETLDKYPTSDLVEAETDMAKLISWLNEAEVKITALDAEIVKLKEIVTEFTTSATSPQVVGKEIILNTKSSGGEGVLQTKFEVSDGAVMEVLKDYSTEDKALWTPTKAGIYTIKAVVKDSNGKSVEKELTYVVYDPVNLKSVTLDQGSSIDLGKSVNINADAAGGNGKLSYSISAENNGTIEKISEVSQNNTATWTPTKAGVWNITVTAVDESGNKSEKQVTLEVKDIAKNQTTIYYKGYSTPYIHYKVGAGSWTIVPGIAMTPTTEMPGYTHKITIDLGTASTLTACFNNGTGSWDSKNGANYTFNAGTYDYSNGIITKVLEPVKTLTINSFTSNIIGKLNVGTSIILTGNATSDASTIEYKMSVINSNNETKVIKDYSTSNISSWTPSESGEYTLVLEAKDSNGKTARTEMKVQAYSVSNHITTIYYKGYTTPYIHYKVGNGSWTQVPGVAMKATTEKVGYTHKITIDLGEADTLTACFNNGSGSWDSKNGANYIFNSGTYTYSNGNSIFINN